MEPDELNPLLLKSMSKSFAVPLTLIFQESLKSAQIPKAWKDARVTPIFKKGQKSKPNDYRPVSLTSVVCKCLEQIVRASVIEHLMKNNLISNAQVEKKTSETDSIKSQISSKTSRGKKDSTKRRHQRHHKRQPGEQLFPIQVVTG